MLRSFALSFLVAAIVWATANMALDYPLHYAWAWAYVVVAKVIAVFLLGDRNHDIVITLDAPKEDE